MNRDDVIELIKEYLSIEVRERVVYEHGIDFDTLVGVDKFIDLKFDGEVISSVELE